MTKRRSPPEPSKSGSRSGRRGLLALAFTLMFGVALAISPDSTADRMAGPRSAENHVIEQVTTSMATPVLGWGVVPQPDGIRTDDWPTVLEAPPAETVPAIAVVIDDLGGDASLTNAAIALPSNVTLSFLPYPKRSFELSRRAHLAGHEVIVHLPMQPSGGENPGERALTTGLPVAELRQRLEWSLSRVSDYDGVNNHMGSLFTASGEDLRPVMQELKARGLFFLDSRTTASSAVEKVAQELGVMSGSRDVFLDYERSVAAIRRQLSRTEQFARKHGSVIAIGHPYPETLKELAAWTETIKERGFRLAPLREVLALRQEQTTGLVRAGSRVDGGALFLTPAPPIRKIRLHVRRNRS